MEFHVRTQESVLNRFILRQSKKFLQHTKLLFLCTLPQSQHTLINEQASRTHEQARMRTEGRSDPDPLKNKKNTQICAKKAVQKAAARMPVFKASSVKALSPPN